MKKIEQQYRNWRVWLCCILLTVAIILEMSESEDFALFLIVHLVGIVMIAISAYLINHWEATGKIKWDEE